MKRIVYIIGIVLVWTFAQPAAAQMDPNAPLPVDESVRHGVLENGMTYYIKANKEPENRASFYIIQNVGALLEEDHQNGLAHFLEHMAFNGTEHYPEKGIIDFLERHGVAFGENINAYTAQNQTVYNLSDVPVNKTGVLDSCLLILNDWSNYLLLTEEEIDSERGVIREEWRTRRSANFRLFNKSLPYLYPNSKFAERDVIGDIDVINNFEYDALRDFYHKWYRTDLQAIAMSGDFDVDEVEKKVIELFSKIPPVEDAPERPFYEIPDNEEPIFGVVTDPEASQTILRYMIRHRKASDAPESIMDHREAYIHQLFNSIMGQRLNELVQTGNPPFVVGVANYGDFARGYEALTAIALPKPNGDAEAFEALLTEVERAKRYGFTLGELDRAKADILSSWEKYYNQRDKISNEDHINGYVNHYLDGNSVLSAEMGYQLVQALLPSITLEDFTQRIPAWITDKNQVLVIQGVEGEGVEHMNEAEAMAIIAKVAAAEIEAYEEEALAESLISEELTEAAVVGEKRIEELNAVEWTLANGAKVVFSKADYEKDQLQLRAFSKGGSSLYEVDDLPSAEMLTSLVDAYGVGDFDAIGLQKMMSGKNASLGLSLTDLSEGMNGRAALKDVETMMQLLYLHFNHPRFDLDAHDALLSRLIAYVENMNNNPQKVMGDSLNLIINNYHPRVSILDQAYLEKVDFERIETIYRERYADASDFTFIIVGNMEEEAVKELAQLYIGSIKDLDRSETWVDRKMREPEGVVEKEIAMDMATPKANVNLVFNQEYAYSAYNRMVLRVIENVLDLRFTESIREEEGGTYGVGLRISASKYPVEKATMRISFDCDPEKADDLKAKVYEELDKLAAEGPSQEDLDKTRENILKDRPEDKAHNAYYLNNIFAFYRYGINYDDPANYEDIIKAMTSKDVKKAMKKLYKKPNVVDVVFVPTAAPEEAAE